MIDNSPFSDFFESLVKYIVALQILSLLLGAAFLLVVIYLSISLA